MSDIKGDAMRTWLQDNHVGGQEIWVHDGDSIQTRINQLEAREGGGVVRIGSDFTPEETGIDVPAGIQVVGPSADTAGVVKADADEYIFELQGGRSQLRHLRIETDTVGGYSSNAIQFSDDYTYGRWWDQLVDVTLIGPIGAGNLSRAINILSDAGNGIAWLSGDSINIVGFQQGIRPAIAGANDYVNACRWRNVSIQETQRGIYEDDNSGGAGEIVGNSYVVGANGDANIADVIYTEAAESIFYTWLFDMGQVTGSAINVTGSAEDIDIRMHTAEGAANISDAGTRTRWFGVIGGGPLGGVDLSTTTGQYEGDLAIADGTSVAGAYAQAQWDATNTQWHYVDPTGTV